MTFKFSPEELNLILINLSNPERLDTHPWTKSLSVKELVSKEPEAKQKSPGYQLALTVCQIFHRMMPSTLPRHGKRLDTSWCQFGFLAAQYFAPFEFGSTVPSSLRDAAGRLDEAVYLYVTRKSALEFETSELEKYKIIGDEDEFVPISTLSDWHTKGLHRLFDLFCANEQRIAGGDDVSKLDPLLFPPKVSMKSFLGKGKKPGFEKIEQIRKNGNNFQEKWKKIFPKVLLGVIFLVVLLLAIKGFRVYFAVKPVITDLQQVNSLDISRTGDWLSQAQSIGPLLTKTRADLHELSYEVKPFLWLGKAFAWMPVYGGDLAAAQDLMDLANGACSSADEVYQIVSPVLLSMNSSQNPPKISEIVILLNENRAQLIEARSASDEALVAEEKIDTQKLSPKVKSLVNKIGPLVSLLDQGISGAIAIPELMGATGSGPKTYMLLLQNEDEIRATGGFITAVGTVAVEDGKVLSYKIEDSYALDDPNLYYPPAPWQLADYMDASHWVLRDANWYPDFPTSARWVEMFFAMSQSYGVDGIIALDQQAIKYILEGLGPIQIEGVSYPITSDNVIDYMRSAKSPAPTENVDSNWYQQRKDFMQGLAQAILERIQSGSGFSWLDLSNSLIQALDERHILIKSDDSSTSNLLAIRGWDGAIHPKEGDFLQVVDSNLGFNKVNAVVKETLSYDIDLSNLEKPKSSLLVNIQNNASGNPACIQEANYGDGSYTALINRCYWDYLRVYTLPSTNLTDASPHLIPSSELMDGKALPAQINNLVDENNKLIKGYGTLLVIPGGAITSVSYSFSLPVTVLKIDGRNTTYQLVVQKQAGTIATPIQLSIHLPSSTTIVNSSLIGKQNGNEWTFSTDLRQDLQFELTFTSN
jgi:hypothetical protein